MTQILAVARCSKRRTQAPLPSESLDASPRARATVCEGWRRTSLHSPVQPNGDNEGRAGYVGKPRPLTPVFRTVRERLLYELSPGAVTAENPRAGLHAPISRHDGLLKIKEFQRVRHTEVSSTEFCVTLIKVNMLDTVVALIWPQKNKTSDGPCPC